MKRSQVTNIEWMDQRRSDIHYVRVDQTLLGKMQTGKNLENEVFIGAFVEATV